VPNATVFPSVLEGPVYTPGKISVTLSVGPDPTKSIQTKAKAATVTFKAIANTSGAPTLVSYGASTQALSIGSNDQASENVLSSSTPATIVIGGAAGPTVPIPTEVPSPTAVITPAPTEVPTPAPTSPATNQAPACSSLTVDKSTGFAPLAINFTANGTDGDGTISKVTFNFGDGQVSDVTTGGGIGTASVSAQTAHTYNSGGTVTASAIMTDNANGVSDSSSCKQTITVNATSSATPTIIGASPAPTIAPTGSTEVAIGIGAAIITFVLGGGFLFFFL